MGQAQLSLVYDRVNPQDTERANKLTRDMERIFQIMLDKKPHLVSDIAKTLELPETSVSSQLRHLRKEKFGSINIQRRSITKGTSYYILLDGNFPKKGKKHD